MEPNRPFSLAGAISIMYICEGGREGGREGGEGRDGERGGMEGGKEGRE